MKISEFVDSAAVKVSFNAILPIFTGVLSGTFVAEITVNGALEWREFYKSYSFYGLLVVVAVIYLYNKTLYGQQIEVERFSDKEYCMAYVRSKCLPEAAARFQELIRTGNGSELSQVMKELKDSLK